MQKALKLISAAKLCINHRGHKPIMSRRTLKRRRRPGPNGRRPAHREAQRRYHRKVPQNSQKSPAAVHSHTSFELWATPHNPLSPNYAVLP
jgi:hypothetical protein